MTSRRSLLLMLLCIGLPAIARAQEYPPPLRVDILHYDLLLDLDFGRKEISGTETITAVARNNGLATIGLDAVGIAVESVVVDARPVRFIAANGQLRVMLNAVRQQGDTLAIAIRYHARPTSGLKFDIDQVYTAFHTERWLVCNADPADKATLALDLILPDTLAVAASGYPAGRAIVSPGRARHAWRPGAACSSYLFAFAAGPFNDTSMVAGGRRHRLLGAIRTDTLARVFAATSGIFAYFQDRAGVELPDTLYTQILLHGDVEQEASNLTLLDESYAGEILADPREDWLIVHEAAHQWWGNLVTCASWSEIWLNEGLATFMTASYKERAWGRDEYDREMVMARGRYERARRDGKNRPLIFNGWQTPAEANGPIAYYKGAAVLNYLRYILGDESFWNGLRDYTRTHAGGTATSTDLRRAMERASGRSLARFFGEWVESADTLGLTAKQTVRNGEVEIEIRQRGRRVFELPMEIAVETSRGRRSHRVVVDEEITVITLPFSGELLALRVDAGGNVPVGVHHERPFPMLLHQIEHEPDVPGRVDAIMEAVWSCGTDTARVRELVGVLERVALEDRSRLVRSVAGGMGKKIKSE